MGIEKASLGYFLQILDPMIEELDFELILIFFPNEFTSLDEMSDNPGSSWFQYPIDFIEKRIYIFDMF